MATETGPGAAAAGQMPTSASALEKEIQAKREHLAATIDELAARTKPQALVKSGLSGVADKVKSATQTPDGQWRVERLAAVGGAVVVLTGAFVWLRRRRS